MNNKWFVAILLMFTFGSGSVIGAPTIFTKVRILSHSPDQLWKEVKKSTVTSIPLNRIKNFTVKEMNTLLKKFKLVSTHSRVKLSEILPTKQRVFLLDVKNLNNKLKKVTDEKSFQPQPTSSLNPDEIVSPNAINGNEITLPLPDGSFIKFSVDESSVMSPKLQAKYPSIRTYDGVRVDNTSWTLRLVKSPQGFHAMIFTPEGSIFIDPILDDSNRYYIPYYRRENPFNVQKSSCLVSQAMALLDFANRPSVPSWLKPLSYGNQLRTYRLAVGATGEYTNYFAKKCNPPAITQSAMVTAALSAIVTTLTRVNGIYERELGIRMILVDHESDVIFTNPQNDPYTNNGGSLLLDENQKLLDQVIDDINYDIGHVFSTGNGGVAVEGVGYSGKKAKGATGREEPINDSFDVNYVAHEMGHQFGASHTFNSTSGSCNGNRVYITACEPMSGTTIMSYAGICKPEDIEDNSDDYFNVMSLGEIEDFLNRAADRQPKPVIIGNHPPIVKVVGPSNITIPLDTPFTLSADGTDSDGEQLGYTWEQIDHGANIVPYDDPRTVPLFRSMKPSIYPTRTFPRLTALIQGETSIGETLPSLPRDILFRVTARDYHPTCGGVNTADLKITVSPNAGPFKVLSQPNLWKIGSIQNVTWNVADTDKAPISCNKVNISLISETNLSSEILLASNVANTGTTQIVVPNQVIPKAHLKITAVDNIFFALSPDSFSVSH